MKSEPIDERPEKLALFSEILSTARFFKTEPVSNEADEATRNYGEDMTAPAAQDAAFHQSSQAAHAHNQFTCDDSTKTELTLDELIKSTLTDSRNFISFQNPQFW